jgi:CRISPR/Cas system-associated protein Csm6
MSRERNKSISNSADKMRMSGESTRGWRAERGIKEELKQVGFSAIDEWYLGLIDLVTCRDVRR